MIGFLYKIIDKYVTLLRQYEYTIIKGFKKGDFMDSGILGQILVIILLVLITGTIVVISNKKYLISKKELLDESYNILSMLQNLGIADEKTKKILRVIMDGIKYVEVSFNDLPNSVKEETAFNFIKEQLDILNFKDELSDDDIKTFIRLGCIFLGPTTKLVDEFLDDKKES